MFIRDKTHKLKNLNININSKNNKIFQKKTYEGSSVYFVKKIDLQNP